MRRSSKRQKPQHVAAIVGCGVITAALSLAMLSPAYGVAVPAPAGISAYVSGTELHVHAVQLPPKVADVDQAFSANSINSGGLKNSVVNEVNELVNPAVAGKQVFARGGGAEVGVGQPVPTDSNGHAIELPVAIAQAATAKAPFADGPIDTPIINLNGALDPIANAEALQGRAAALWNPNFLFPMLGNPIAYGYGTAADAEALNVGGVNPISGDFLAPLVDAQAPGPERNVASSQSFSYLVNNGDGTCGIATETHMSIAPVQISLPPNPDAPQTGLLIEVGGDWVMKAVATGKPTGNKLTYSPYPNQDPASFVLRVMDLSQPPGSQVLASLSLQDVLGNTGIAEQLDALDPLADVAIGADPRAIAAPGAIPDDTSSPTVSPTVVSGAADVVRLKIASGLAAPFEAADIRVGHFETSIHVPAGGINCEIPVAKTSSLPVAGVGTPVTFQIKVPSDANAVKPFPCDLTKVTVTDVLTLEKADNPSKPPHMNILSGTGPKGEPGKVASDGQSIVFTNIGPWKPGAAPLLVTLKTIVASDSGTGIVKDEATAVATPANCKSTNSVLGSVIDSISNLIGGNLSFFGSEGSGLTGNIRGGGPVAIVGKGVLGGPKLVQVGALGEKLPSTGLNDGPRVLVALAFLTSAPIIEVLRRRRLKRMGAW